MPARPRIDSRTRRARLVARHHLARTATDVEGAVRDIVVLHSSDPATPHLALWTRVPGFATGDLDRALYGDRSLWRLHGMRRTLFVVVADDAAVVTAACGRDIAAAERRKLEGWVSQSLGREAEPWLAAVETQTRRVLADGVPRRTQELASLVDGLELRITLGSGRWTTEAPLSSRLLFLLAMEGHIVRAHPAGSWLSSQYHWADVGSWFGGEPAQLDAAAGRAHLARAWLRVHGPGTTADLKWWTGWTVKRTVAALEAVDAVEVALDGGTSGWVLADDVETHEPAARGVALLCGLDPTVMGWKEREWYLGDHTPQLFDRNGNAGPTVWHDGRVVGGWGQRPDGEVVTRLLTDVGSAAAAAVDAEASALTAWLDGVVVSPRFRTPLERELSGHATAATPAQEA